MVGLLSCSAPVEVGVVLLDDIRVGLICFWSLPRSDALDLVVLYSSTTLETLLALPSSATGGKGNFDSTPEDDPEL